MSRADGLGWLTRRLVFGRPERLATSVVVGLAVALLTVLGLVTVAVPQAVSTQSDRAQQRTATLSYSDQAAESATLFQLDPLGTASGRRWDGHPIGRTVYAGNGRDREVPGITRVPRPGEYFASPDLVRLIHRDPIVRALFAGRHLVGTITKPGLVQPHELRTIEAVPVGTPLLLPVTGFGGVQRGIRPTDSESLNATVAIATAVAVWGPALVLLLVISRLTSRARARRSRALRSQGLSKRQVRAMMGAEVALVAVPAAAVGALCYLLGAHVLSRIPGTSFGAYPADLRMPLPVMVGVALLVAGLAAVSAAFSLPMNDSETSPVRKTRPRRAVVTGLGMLAVGVGYLIVLPVVARITQWAPTGIWISIALILVGLAVAGPRLIMIWSTALAGKTGAAGRLVGLRLSSWAPTTAMRLGSLVAILIVLTLGITGFVNLLAGGGTKAWADATDHNQQVGIAAHDLTGRLDRTMVASAAERHAVAGEVDVPLATGKHHSHPVVFATCSDLSVLTGRPVHGCSARGGWLQTGAARHDKPLSGDLKLTAKRSMPVPPARSIVHVPGAPSDFDGAIVLPPQTTHHNSYDSGGTTFHAVARGSRADQMLATINGQAPTAQFDLGALDRSWPGHQQYRAQYQWLMVGIMTGAALGGLALLAATLGESADRRRRLAGMRRLGSPTRALVSAHYWSTAWPPLAMGLVGTGLGWLICHELIQFDDRQYVPGKFYLGAVVVVVGTALLIATISVGDTRRDASEQA